MYLQTENGQAIQNMLPEMKKYENSSMSKVTNFQPLLAFTMGHIPTKLHQFLMSSF